MHKNFYRFFLMILGKLSFFTVENIFYNRFFDDGLNSWRTRKHRLFGNSIYDNRISLDVHLPVDRRNQVEKLIEIRSYMLSKFKK